MQHRANFIPSNTAQVILSNMVWACHNAYMEEIIKANKNLAGKHQARTAFRSQRNGV
jgi:hypothetical protein